MSYELRALNPKTDRKMTIPCMKFSIFEYGPIYYAMIYMNQLARDLKFPNLSDSDMLDLSRNNTGIVIGEEIIIGWLIGLFNKDISGLNWGTENIEYDEGIIKLKLLDEMMAPVPRGAVHKDGTIEIEPEMIRVDISKEQNIVNPYIVTKENALYFLLFITNSGGFVVE